MIPITHQTSLTSKYQWVFTYKLHHLPFWLGYHFLWWTLRLGSPLAVMSSLLLPHAAVKFSFYLLFQMAGVYFNLYFLIPKFLAKGRYITYVFLLLLVIISTASLIVTGYYLGALISDRPFQELFGVDPHNYYSLFESGALPSTAAAMTLAMSIKLTRSWMQARRREKLLETEKLETELKFLRAQFNPHFLFNTINSIFVLINKNPAMASEALAKFSDLLRYQLYECNENEIPLEQELTYLKGFIELEKLRHDSNISLSMTLESEYVPDLVIAPFVLIPFIENAFKHVSQGKGQRNWISLDLRFESHRLHFEITNSTSPANPASREFNPHKGLGLKNVQRRLDLIYPNKHTLKINHDPNRFSLSLELDLRERVSKETFAKLQPV